MMTHRDVLAALDAQRRPRPNLETPLTLPRDLIEEALSELWAEVLCLSDVGVFDSFFTLGGDSLHMTQVASRLRAQFGIEISFTQFFEQPTIAGLAVLIRGHLGVSQSEITNAPLITVSGEAPPAPSQAEFVVPQLALDGDKLAIGRLVVPTRDRAVPLLRCLRSYMANLRQYGRDCRISVADQTRDDSASAEVAEAVARLGRDFGLPVEYCGVRERAGLIEHLCRSGLDPDVVAFALSGWPDADISASGASRNVLSLLAADEAYVSIDDDTECVHGTEGNPDPPNTMGDGNTMQLDPSDLRAFKDPAEFQHCVELGSLDFMEAHQQLLGRTHDAEPNNKSSLPAAHGQVLITLMGVAGDCGWGSPSRYLSYHDDRTVGQLAGSRSDWAVTLSSRNTLRVSRSYCTRSRADLLMTTAFGADNRVLLPPFLPVGRGSDMVLGHMIPSVHPGARFGYLPWAVLHSPAETRRFWRGEHTRSAGSTDIATMMCALIPVTIPNLAGASALTAIGRSLQDLASRPRAEFVEVLGEQVVKTASAHLSVLEQRADALSRVAPHWSEDVREYILHARGRLADPAAGIPVEFLYGREFEHAAELTRKLVSQFGKLLAAWPDFRVSVRQFR